MIIVAFFNGKVDLICKHRQHFLSFQKLKDEPRFGGFMLWDAGFDQNNVINGKPYSENIVEMMNSGVVPPSPTGSPQTLPPNTAGPDTAGPNTAAPTTAAPPVPPTKPCMYILIHLAFHLQQDDLLVAGARVRVRARARVRARV